MTGFFTDYSKEWQQEQREKAHILALDHDKTLEEARRVRKACSSWKITVDKIFDQLKNKPFTSEWLAEMIANLDYFIQAMSSSNPTDDIFVDAAQKIQVAKGFLIMLENTR